MEQSAKKVFSSDSLALKSTNVTCLLGHHIHVPMESAREVLPKLPEEVQGHFSEVLTNAKAATRQVIQSGHCRFSCQGDGIVCSYQEARLVTGFRVL